MVNVRGRVKNGRLIVDEPTDLPDGTEVDLVEAISREELLAIVRAAPPADEPLSKEEAEELRAIDARGQWIPHEEVRRKLAAKRLAEGNDPPESA